MGRNRYEEMQADFEAAWGPIQGAFGASMDAATHRLKWRPEPELLPSHESARSALAAGISTAWGMHERTIAAEPTDAMLATTLFNSFVNAALRQACKADLFLAASQAMDDCAPLIENAWVWHGSMGLMAGLACEDPYGRDPSLAQAAGRWEALSASAWWGIEPTAEAIDQSLMDRESTLNWKESIASMCAAATKRPALAAAAASIVEKWSEACWPGIPSHEHFGREVGHAVKREMIPKGEISNAVWCALPFDARLGICLDIHAESKMGRWTMDRMLSDLALDASPEGARRRRAVCSAFWSSLERPRIEAMEAAFPQSSEEWLRPGMLERMSKNSGSTLEWHYAGDDWDAKRSAWAKPMLAKAGHGGAMGKEGFMEHLHGKPEAYAQALCDLRSMRQAAAIKAALPPKPKTKATKAKSL